MVEDFDNHQIPKDIRFFENGIPDGRKAIVAKVDDNVAGILSYVEDSFAFPGYLGVGAVSVHPAFRSRGVATKLVEEIFKRVKSDKGFHGIRFTEYEPDGALMLKHKVRQMAKKYDVPLIEGFSKFQGDQ